MNNIFNSNRAIKIDIIHPNLKSKCLIKIYPYIGIFKNFGFRIEYLK